MTLVYKFVGEAKWALAAIERRRLKIATLSEINDPFELRAYCPRDRAERRIFEKHRNAASKYAGIVSFSGSWRSSVMWSHYGDRHRGMCLGFEVDPKALCAVQYVDERATKSPNYKELDNLKYPLEMFSTKYSHWKYEEELRLVVRLKSRDPATGLYFLPFGREMQLREVIFGAHCDTPLDVVESLLVGIPNVTLHKARLAFADFSVTLQRSRRLQQKRSRK